MTESNPFNDLLEAMPRIAEAVNSFVSPDVQLRAYDNLVGTFGLPTPAGPTPIRLVERPDGDTSETSVPTAVQDSTDGITTTASRRAARRSSTRPAKKSFSVEKGIDFAPVGKTSLADLVAEKKPRNQNEKNLLACYYLQEILERPVAFGGVLAVYQTCDWVAPSHPDVSLFKTASEHGWIDTADTKSIKVVWAGLNYLTSKMPTADKPRAKSA